MRPSQRLDLQDSKVETIRTGTLESVVYSVNLDGLTGTFFCFLIYQWFQLVHMKGKNENTTATTNLVMFTVMKVINIRAFGRFWSEEVPGPPSPVLKRVHPSNKENSHVHIALYVTVVLRTTSRVRFRKPNRTLPSRSRRSSANDRSHDFCNCSSFWVSPQKIVARSGDAHCGLAVVF